MVQSGGKLLHHTPNVCFLVVRNLSVAVSYFRGSGVWGGVQTAAAACGCFQGGVLHQ